MRGGKVEVTAKVKVDVSVVVTPLVVCRSFPSLLGPLPASLWWGILTAPAIVSFLLLQ